MDVSVPSRSREGYRHLEWRCSCGTQLSADFDNSDPEALEELLKELHHPEHLYDEGTNAMIAEAAAEMIRQLEQTRSAERSLAGPGTTNQPSAFWRTLYPAPGSSGVASGDPASDTKRTSSGYDPARHTQPAIELDPLTSVVHAPPVQETPQQQTKQFFEVCLTSGKHVVRLHEIDLDGVKFDGDLFQRIREQYRRAKRFYSIRKMFLTPKDVHFVMFSVTRAYNNLAGIHAKPSEYPPPEELDKGRYHYRRPKILMPAHVFLHFLRTPRGPSGCSHRHDTWLQRLPKKLNASLLEEVQVHQGNGRFVNDPPLVIAQQETRDQEDIVFGWGVHIIDGPNHLCLSLLLVLGIFATSIVSVTVAVVAGTEEQAFGIGQYLVAILTCGLTAGYLVLDNW